MIEDASRDAAVLEKSFSARDGWGFTACIDLFGCTNEKLKDQQFIAQFLRDVVKEIKMQPYGEPQVHRFGQGDLEGVSGFQLIQTSNLTIHCDEVGNRAFITIESCACFDPHAAADFCQKAFDAKEKTLAVLFRGAKP